MTDDVSNTTFEPHVGSEFIWAADAGGDGTTTFRLAEVELGTPREHGDRQQPFTLVFDGQVEPTLPQQTYSLDHADLGRLDVFLVPIAPGRYEAIFN